MIVERLEHVRREGGRRLEERARLLGPALLLLQHAQVVVSLGVVMVGDQRQAETLVGQADVGYTLGRGGWWE